MRRVRDIEEARRRKRSLRADRRGRRALGARVPAPDRDRRRRLGRPRRGDALRRARPCGLYRWMVLSRELDERMVQLQRQGRIGFYIGAIGEEATVLGTAAAHAPAGLDLPVLPRARRAPSARHAARDLRLRPPRQRRRPDAGPPDALPRGLGARPLRLHQLAHRHAGPAGGRRRLGRPHPRRRHGGAHLLRRRRHERQRLPHRPQLRRRPQDRR